MIEGYVLSEVGIQNRRPAGCDGGEEGETTYRLPNHRPVRKVTRIRKTFPVRLL